MKKIIGAIALLMMASGVWAQSPQEPLTVGDKAPEFKLENALGKQVSLKKALKKGPVVVTWYRGSWCPYCNIALAELQQYSEQFDELGAQIIAISPQLPDSTLTLKEKKALDFAVLSDPNNSTADTYGVAFKLDEKTHQRYEDRIKLSQYNGDKSGRLPIPATYIIDEDGIIRYSYVNEDYTKRVDPEILLKELKMLQ